MTNPHNPKIPFGIFKGFRLSDLIAGGDTGADYLAKAQYYQTIPEAWQEHFAQAYLQTPRHLGTLTPYSLKTEKALLLRAGPKRAYKDLEASLFEKRLHHEAQVLQQQVEHKRRAELITTYAPQLDLTPQALQEMVTQYGILLPWQGDRVKEALYQEFCEAYYTLVTASSIPAPLPPYEDAYRVAFVGKGNRTHAIKGYASLCGKRVRRGKIRYVEEVITCQRCQRYLALYSQPK